MLSLNITVTNPFVTNKFRNLFCKHGSFSKHKHWEVEFMFNLNTIFAFELYTQLSGLDHAGPKLIIGLLCFELSMSMYDSRHWDDETNDWEYYGS
jgi:hypothetical protein